MSPISSKAGSTRLGRASATTAEARAVRPAWLAVLIVGVAGLAGLAGLAGCSAAGGQAATGHPAASPSASIHFGAYPSFLPRSTLNNGTDTLLTGTVQRPALTNQGDRVKVRTAAFTVLVTVSGPQVPGEGLPYQAPSTTCTWVVTMSGATGTVPISTADFTSLDDLNNVYRPQFVKGQPRPPRLLRPGQTVTFELRAAMATGEGLMRWAPDGHNIVAKWDFVVEND